MIKLGYAALGQRAAKTLDIESSRLLQVPGRDGQMKHVHGIAHHSVTGKVSERKPRRSVSSAITSSARTLAKLAEEPIRRRK
jgi:hypothetical protein